MDTIINLTVAIVGLFGGIGTVALTWVSWKVYVVTAKTLEHESDNSTRVAIAAIQSTMHHKATRNARVRMVRH